jgi:beta-lactamase superfamily II metal-dependent hydrolase
MPRVHFLNVNDGDCSIIQHTSGRNTVIDVSAAKKPAAKALVKMSMYESIVANVREWSKSAGVSGNFSRSEYPDNPIAYMKERGITSVFRFISSHPDMDHLDGIMHFFEEFGPGNFWDTDNTKELDDFGGPYNSDDWDFYTSLRDGNPQANPKRLVLYAGARGAFYNQDQFGNGGGDGLHILAPTPELIAAANEAEDWNDSSYVILYRTAGGKRILFAGDSHDLTWEYILASWRSSVAGVDVLIAPHHGRDSDRDYAFLDVVKPRLTLFGNAPSEHLAYDQWNSRDLMFITNNQAGTIILDLIDTNLDVYVSHEPFARAFVEGRHYGTYYSADTRGWFIGRWR